MLLDRLTRRRFRARKPPARAVRAPRAAVAGLTAIIDTGHRFWAGEVRDVSASGCFVLSDKPARVGKRVRLHPTHADDHLLPFEVSGVVVRNTGDGFALNFEELPSVERERLNAFVMRHGTRAVG